MTPKQVIESALRDSVINDAGELVDVGLLSPASEEQIGALEERLGTSLSGQMRELLEHCSGLDPGGLVEAVSFLGLGELDHPVFEGAVDLCGDGAGGYWFVEAKDGVFGPVLFASAKPRVVAMQSETLTDFLRELLPSVRPTKESGLARVHQSWVSDIWRKEPYLQSPEEATTIGDDVVAAFARELPEGYGVCDLRRFQEGRGFSWGRSDEPIVRHASGALLFGVPGDTSSKPWWSRLLGG